MPNEHKYELRHIDDNRLLAHGDTLTEFFKSVYYLYSEDMEKSLMYVNRIVIATGKEVNEFTDAIDTGDLWNL